MIDKLVYTKRCRFRWSGEYLHDAISNWDHFETLKDDLVAALRKWKHNPFMQDAGGKCHNPHGTITSMLWILQDAWQPNKSCLNPLLDFCEGTQRIHLRRGLIYYCNLILEEMDKPKMIENQEALL